MQRRKSSDDYEAGPGNAWDRSAECGSDSQEIQRIDGTLSGGELFLYCGEIICKIIEKSRK